MIIILGNIDGFNGSSPSPVKYRITGTPSALYTCSPNQLIKPPVATKMSVETLLNVLLCNLKFIPKTLCSPSLLRWQLSVVWKLFPYQCSFRFEGNEWINVFDRAIRYCDVNESADIKLPTVNKSSPTIYTTALFSVPFQRSIHQVYKKMHFSSVFNCVF